MKNSQSLEKYLDVLRELNSIRRITYRRLTSSLDSHLQKLFAKFSIDSMINANELDEVITNKKTERFTDHHSFEPLGIMQALNEGSSALFDQCREAEWRLVRFYEEVISDPRVNDKLRSQLIPQRDKVMMGYEHLNLLSSNPW